MEDTGIKGLSVALLIHGVAFGVLFVAGTINGKDSIASDSDPILLMLPGDDDPKKSAGIVGNQRGPARGTRSGQLFDPGEYTKDRLDKIAEANKAAEEATRKANEEATRRVAEETPPAQGAANRVVRHETTQQRPPNNANNNHQVVPLRQLMSTRRNGNNRQNSSGGRQGSQRISGTKINTGNLLGTSSGTGENGGDGGRGVANARAVYADAVAKIFAPHFENIVAQNPLPPASLPQNIIVDVRFSVDSRGNIKFLEVVGSSDPNIRDRIKKAFMRAFPNKFREPPGGNAFTGRINGISFIVDQ